MRLESCIFPISHNRPRYNPARKALLTSRTYGATDIGGWLKVLLSEII